MAVEQRPQSYRTHRAARSLWWLNLKAHPQARVLLTDGTHEIVANAATGQERPGCGSGDGRRTRIATTTPVATTWSPRAARESIERLARLEPTVLADGHGRPMTGDGTAEALSAYAERARDL